MLAKISVHYLGAKIRVLPLPLTHWSVNRDRIICLFSFQSTGEKSDKQIFLGHWAMSLLSTRLFMGFFFHI